MIRLARLLSLLPVLLVAGWSSVFAAEDFLPPEQAFRFEARVLDERTVEAAFTIAPGYYLYREQFKFAADDGVTLGPADVPAGKVKFDETFQKNVETYRDRVAIRIPVTAAPSSFRLRVTSQGCADLGLCYPPMQSVAEVRLAAFGGDGRLTVVDNAAALSVPSSSATAAATDQPVSAQPAGSSVEQALRSGRFWWVVGAFFIAGLLLSLTPCVLPMLPILSSIIIGPVAGVTTRTRGLALALAYSLGMALVYTALGIAAGLAGEGLAATLQKPWVLGAFASLLAVLALSMFGFYELQLPASLRDRLSHSSQRLHGGQFAGVFAMGGLSALIVSPCVAAPLAGALLYISQTRNVLLGGTALFSLAAGMSVPLLIVGASAGSLLPRTGAWMDGVKRFFGFALLAVAWWTLSPVLPAALAVAGWGVWLLAAAVFLHAFDRLTDQAGAGVRLGKAMGIALAVAGATQIVGAAAGADDALQPLRPLLRGGGAAGLVTAPASAAGVVAAVATPSAEAGVGFRRIASVDELDAAVRAAGRPVMLDFYADWCVSCKEMERFTFSDPAVRARLDQLLLLQADVTANTDADRALLKRFQLFGPPGIVFFDRNGREISTVRVIGYQEPRRFEQSLQAAGL